MRRRSNIAYELGSVLRSRALSVLVFCAAVSALSIWVVSQQRFVTIYDEGRVIASYTARTDLAALLDEQGVELGEYDEVTFSGPGKYMEIDIERAYPVYVTADGRTSRVYVTDATVDEALQLCQVSLGADDLLSLPLDRPLGEKEEVVVTRVDYDSDHYTEPIAYETDYKLTSLLRTGARRVQAQGSDGVKQITVRQKYVDGAMIASRETSELVTVEPVNSVALEGQAGAFISEYEPFPGVVADERGWPVNYTAVYTGMRTTSYYTGHTCASGLPAQVGHVGVNPAVFPYGTKLFIASEDGSFVYGYCIAADCGPGTLKNVIDIDLFLDTYYECSLLGRRNNIVVYVLP